MRKYRVPVHIRMIMNDEITLGGGKKKRRKKKNSLKLNETSKLKLQSKMCEKVNYTIFWNPKVFKL